MIVISRSGPCSLYLLSSTTIFCSKLSIVMKFRFILHNKNLSIQTFFENCTLNMKFQHGIVVIIEQIYSCCMRISPSRNLSFIKVYIALLRLFLKVRVVCTTQTFFFILKCKILFISKSIPQIDTDIYYMK